MRTLLLANPDSTRDAALVQSAISDASWNIVVDNSGSSLSTLTRRHQPDLVLMRVPPTQRRAHLSNIESQLRERSVPVFLLIPGEQWDAYSRIIPHADDIVLLPLQRSELIARVSRWQLQKSSRDTKSAVDAIENPIALAGIIGDDTTFLRIKQQLPAIARARASVLITGETGTGKDLIAGAIHYLSDRASGPFISINCGALPIDLFESELFGHQRGAFTGAVTTTRGCFCEAHKGTLFLDEIDTIPIVGQVKLLRVLQTGSYRPLGNGSPQKADVRIVAATNANLADQVREGMFRADLFYRLSIIPIHLPALRDRIRDIPLLLNHFLKVYAREYQVPQIRFAADALQVLEHHDWQGNIRELENLVQRMMALSTSVEITAAMLPDSFNQWETSCRQPITLRDAKALAIERFERDFVSRLLGEHDGNISRAAQAVDTDRRAFGRLVKKHGLK